MVCDGRRCVFKSLAINRDGLFVMPDACQGNAEVRTGLKIRGIERQRGAIFANGAIEVAGTIERYSTREGFLRAVRGLGPKRT